MPIAPSSGCLSAAEIATLLGSDDTPSDAADHLNACEACQGRMQRMLVGGTRAATLSAAGAPAAADDTPPAVPGYSFETVIGVGGMGAVWRAVQHLPSRTVAVKFLRGGRGLVSAEALARLRQEANAAARLQHPNVVTLYEFREDPIAGPFLTMEYVPGGTLADRMLAGPARPADACRLVRALAEAVGYANARGVIHRDLKPSNVLLAADGTPKVSDFGIARLQDAEADPDVAGTPHYMAPEQARGGPVDARADVYALGAVLFELLTGQTPFLGDAAAVLVAAERTAPPRVRRLRPGVPAAVDAVCARCLCHDPHGRYDTTHDLAADLGRFLDGRPVEALPTSRAARALMWVRRNKAAAAALALGAALLFVGGPTVTYLWLSAESAYSNLKTETDKRETAEGKEKTSRDYALAALIAQPSAEDLDPIRKRVRLSGVQVRPVEHTLESLRRFVPIFGDTKEGAAAGWLVHAVDAEKAALTGDWVKADETYQKVADSIEQMLASPDQFTGKDYLRVVLAKAHLDRAAIRRNLGRFEAAEASARAALAALDRAGQVGDELERRRLRRDALLEHLCALRGLGEHVRADATSVLTVRAAEDLATSPGEAEDLTALGQCLVFFAQEPGPRTRASEVEREAERGLAAHLRVHQAYPTLLAPAFRTGEAYLLLAHAKGRQGDLAGAEKHVALGLSLLKELARRHPDYSEITLTEAAGTLTAADLKYRRGLKPEAERLTGAAVESLDALRTRFPASPPVLSGLAEARYALAKAQAASGNQAAADRSFASAAQALAELPGEVRKLPRFILAAARAYLELAELRLRSGQAVGSQQAAGLAVESLHDWSSRAGSTDPERLDAASLLDRCVLPRELIAPSGADKLIAACKALAAGEGPTRETTALLRGQTAVLRAVTLARARQPDDAIEALVAGRREFDTLNVQGVSDPDLLRVVGRGYFFVARTYQQIGRRFEWAEAERKAISFRRKLLAARPTEFGPADDLAHSLAFLGDALGAETDPDAEQAYAEAVKLWDALEERHPTATVTLTNRVIALAGVAACCLGQDRFPQAKEALARGRELLDRIPPDQAGSADALTAGRHLHNRAAQFRAGQGDHVGCASAAAELVRGRERDAFALGSAAFYLARCRTLAEWDKTLPRPDRAKLAADYAELAVKRLGAAVDAGYGDLTFVETRAEYRALADRSDFRTVLAKLKANQK